MPVYRPTIIDSDIELLVRPIEVEVFYSRQYLGAPIGSAGSPIGDWDPPTSMGRPAQPVPIVGETALLHRPHVVVKFRNLRERSPSKGTFNVVRDVGSVQTLRGSL
jgi:hypothetical protein